MMPPIVNALAAGNVYVISFARMNSPAKIIQAIEKPDLIFSKCITDCENPRPP